jgi:hypothetical protein
VIAESLVDVGKEAYFLDPGGIALDQMVAAHAQFSDQPKLIGLHVFDPAPGQIRRVLAGEPGEIQPVDQGDPGAFTG